MTTPLTNADLDQLDALAQAATPGLRRGRGIGGALVSTIYGSDRGGNVVAFGVSRDADADLFVASHLAIPALPLQTQATNPGQHK